MSTSYFSLYPLSRLLSTHPLSPISKISSFRKRFLFNNPPGCGAVTHLRFCPNHNNCPWACLSHLPSTSSDFQTAWYSAQSVLCLRHVELNSNSSPNTQLWGEYLQLHTPIVNSILASLTVSFPVLSLCLHSLHCPSWQVGSSYRCI